MGKYDREIFSESMQIEQEGGDVARWFLILKKVQIRRNLIVLRGEEGQTGIKLWL